MDIDYELESFLTMKHQLRLLLQILNSHILPSSHFNEEDKTSLVSASDLISNVHSSLEDRFQKNLKGSFYE